MTKSQTEYAAFIDRLGLKHFKGAELARYADRTRGGVKNSIPPEGLWTNMIPTIIIADAIREEYAGPITITSAYRSPAYNRAVGGEAASFHMRNQALDLIANNIPRLFQIARNLRGKRFRLPGNGGSFLWRGGIGRYPGFVHVDTRGYNADW